MSSKVVLAVRFAPRDQRSSSSESDEDDRIWRANSKAVALCLSMLGPERDCKPRPLPSNQSYSTFLFPTFISDSFAYAIDATGSEQYLQKNLGLGALKTSDYGAGQPKPQVGKLPHT
jgi:hypothetical protein